MQEGTGSSEGQQSRPAAMPGSGPQEPPIPPNPAGDVQSALVKIVSAVAALAVFIYIAMIW